MGLVDIVGQAADDLTSSGYVFVTQGIHSLQQLAKCSASDLRRIVNRFGSALAAACLLHYEIAARSYPAETKPSSFGDPKEPLFQLVAGRPGQLPAPVSLESLECAFFFE